MAESCYRNSIRYRENGDSVPKSSQNEGHRRVDDSEENGGGVS